MLAWECHWETAAYLTRSQRRAVGPEAVTEAATSKHGVGGMELGTKAATSKHHGGESGVGMEQGSQQSVKARAKERAMETGECWCHCNGDEFTWNMAADGVATVQLLGKDVAEHYPVTGCAGLHVAAEGLYKIRDRLPWQQQWVDVDGTNVPNGRLSFWHMGREVPTELEGVVGAALGHPALKKYDMLGNPLFSVQVHMYRGGVQSGGYTWKDTEGIRPHDDGPEVNNKEYPIIHVYVSGEAFVTFAAGSADATLKGVAGSMTVMLPGADGKMEHARACGDLRQCDAALTMVLRVMAEAGGSKYDRPANRVHMASKQSTQWLQEWTLKGGPLPNGVEPVPWPPAAVVRANQTAHQAGYSMEGYMSEKTYHHFIDWTNLPHSRICHFRTLPNPVLLDGSIRALLVANEEKGVDLVLQQQRNHMFSPGDVFKGVTTFAYLGLDVNTHGAAVKGSRLAGGAVSLCCRPKMESVVPIHLTQSSFKFCYNASSKAGNTLLAKRMEGGGTARMLGALPKWNGHGGVGVYLGDAMPLQRCTDQFGLWWCMECDIGPGPQRALLANWLEGYRQCPLPNATQHTHAECAKCWGFTVEDLTANLFQLT